MLLLSTKSTFWFLTKVKSIDDFTSENLDVQVNMSSTYHGKAILLFN